jgi:dTDP-4-amino-4,6-dideoxygalactose transaminase
LTTFSFFPTKNLTTAEGGAISSTNKNLLERARKFSRQGLVREPEQFKNLKEGPWHQEVHEFGLNYRLPDVLCALGISQLARLNEFKRRRREISDLYIEILRDTPWVELPTEKEYVDSNWHLFPIRVPASNRKRIVEELHRAGIGVQVNYIPAYRHPVFDYLEIDYTDFPNSESFYSREISLPMYVDLGDSDIDHICRVLKSLGSRW